MKKVIPILTSLGVGLGAGTMLNDGDSQCDGCDKTPVVVTTSTTSSTLPQLPVTLPPKKKPVISEVNEICHQEPKTVYRDRIVEKVVYKDRLKPMYLKRDPGCYVDWEQEQVIMVSSRSAHMRCLVDWKRQDKTIIVRETMDDPPIDGIEEPLLVETP